MEQQGPTNLFGDVQDLFNFKESGGEEDLSSPYIYQSDSPGSPVFFDYDKDNVSDKISIPVTKSIQKTPKVKKKYDNIPNELRIQLIDTVEKGEKIKHAAKRLSINYSSAKAIYQIYRREGRSDKRILKRRVPKEEPLIRSSHDTSLAAPGIASMQTYSISSNIIGAPMVNQSPLSEPKDSLDLLRDRLLESRGLNSQQQEKFKTPSKKEISVASPQINFADINISPESNQFKAESTVPSNNIFSDFEPFWANAGPTEAVLPPNMQPLPVNNNLVTYIPQQVKSMTPLQNLNIGYQFAQGNTQNLQMYDGKASSYNSSVPIQQIQQSHQQSPISTQSSQMQFTQPTLVMVPQNNLQLISYPQFQLYNNGYNQVISSSYPYPVSNQPALVYYIGNPQQNVPVQYVNHNANGTQKEAQINSFGPQNENENQSSNFHLPKT